MMSGDRFWLTDAQFARLEPYLPRDTRGKPRVEPALFGKILETARIRPVDEIGADAPGMCTTSCVVMSAEVVPSMRPPTLAAFSSATMPSRQCSGICRNTPRLMNTPRRISLRRNHQGRNIMR